MNIEHFDDEHKDAFIKASFTFYEKVLDLQKRVMNGEMTVENFIDHLHVFKESIEKQDIIRQERRDRYKEMGMDPDEADR